MLLSSGHCPLRQEGCFVLAIFPADVLSSDKFETCHLWVNSEGRCQTSRVDRV